MTKTILPTLLTAAVFAGLGSASAAAQNLAVNGDFETGDTSSWVSFPTATSTFTTTMDAASGSFAGEIVNVDPASSAVVKQANLGVGTVMPGATVDISFAAKGTGNIGGVAFAEFFSELSGGGVSSSALLGGAPLPITSSWQTFTFQTTAGTDVSGGITLQFAAVTGGATGSTIELFIDDVVIEATNNTIQLDPYAEDFEALNMADPAALNNAGWTIFANVFDSAGFLYNYGPFPAPNGGPAFSAIASGQGGPDQGAQQLVIYSDYNNQDHGNGFLIDTSVFQEQVIGDGDVGKTFTFQFDAKLGDLVAPSTASAFIRIIDNATFALEGEATMDTTALPFTWGTYSLSITIEPQHIGDFFQLGFSTQASNFTPSGVVYDNIVFGEAAGLGMNYCMAAANSTGAAASISASGSAVAADNDLTLTASGLPTGETTIFIVSPDQGFFPGINGVSDGNLCVAGPLARFAAPGQVQTSDAMGTASLSVDLTAIPQGIGTVPTLPGQTWNFQAWFRDSSPLGSNLTDGLEITFN